MDTAGTALIVIASLMLFAGPVLAAEPELNESNSWAFRPPEDPVAPGSLIDLSHLNEDVAGETGFIRVDEDGGFVRGDGEPIRFWSAITRADYHVARMSPEQIDRMYAFLAKHGVNMLRLFAMLPVAEQGAEITDVHREQIDAIWRAVSIGKKHGVYSIICPYWAHFRVPASWGLAGGAQPSTGLLFFNPKVQAAYREWVRPLYADENPYTGIPLAEDPSVAIIQVQNEDSLFFWTTGNLPEPQMRILGEQFGGWLKEKYGSLAAAKEAWDGYAAEGDDFSAGVAGMVGGGDMIWHMTQDAQGGKAKRLHDQSEFLARLQRDLYGDMRRYFRDELGCGQLVNASNWRTASQLRLEDIERWTYGACDVVALNRYSGGVHVGENRGYRIDPGHHLISRSVTRDPLRVPTNVKQNAGLPFILTENAWVAPNLYQSEGPLLVAAYMGLSGVDTVCWFDMDGHGWQLDPRRKFWPVVEGETGYALGKWSGLVPEQVGMFPANALLHRMGYVQRGRTVVREVRPLEGLWEREPAIIAEAESFDPIRDTRDLRGATGADVAQVSRLAFLVGPVEVEYGGDPAETRALDLSPYVDGEAGVVRSVTGELELRYGDGVFALNAPKAKGVAGFLKGAGGRFELGALTIESDNDYATIEAVALDDRPLAESEQVLVQVGTVARLTGWQTEDVTFEYGGDEVQGERIVRTGKPPWRIMNTRATIRIANPNLTEAVLLDVGGYPARQIDVQREGDTLTVPLPEETMYLVLR